MTQGTAPEKVLFNMENLMKCQCTKCPVQSESSCVKGKVENMNQAMQKNPLEKADIPGMYCATGQAVCRDTDYSKMCICTTCLIWTEYGLANRKPMGYFCRDGASM